jgi:hypothetical protein
MESPPPSRTDRLPPARRARRGRWAGRFGRARRLTVTTQAGTAVAPVTAAAAASERSAPPAAISSTARVPGPVRPPQRSLVAAAAQLGQPERPPGLSRRRRPEEAVKVYGKGQTEVRALDGVTVEFAAGRYTAVMGPSGSGIHPAALRGRTTRPRPPSRCRPP